MGVKQQHGGKQQQEEEGKHRIEDKVICSPEKRKKHCNVSSLDADQQQKPQNQQQHQSPTDRAWGVSSSVSARPPSREARAYSRANGPLHQQQQRQQQQPDASGCSCGCRGHRHGAPRVALASYKAPGYTPVYSDNASRYLVSVNAGDPQLYVGGGSINLAFLRAINEGASRASLQQRGPLGGLDPSWGQRMRDVHASALAAARRAPTGTAALHCADAPGGPSGGPVPPQFPFWGIFSIVPTREEAAEAKIKETDCFVSLDMFHREMRPLSEKNIGMVYVVGPKGWAYSKDNFYRARKYNCCSCRRVVVRFRLVLKPQQHQQPETMPLSLSVLSCPFQCSSSPVTCCDSSLSTTRGRPRGPPRSPPWNSCGCLWYQGELLGGTKIPFLLLLLLSRASLLQQRSITQQQEPLQQGAPQIGLQHPTLRGHRRSRETRSQSGPCRPPRKQKNSLRGPLQGSLLYNITKQRTLNSHSNPEEMRNPP